MGERLLDVDNLTVKFHSEDGAFTAVDKLSFNVDKGESVCIVGESGCGKSVTSLAIMGLLNIPPAEVTGKIDFNETKTYTGQMVNGYLAIRYDKVTLYFGKTSEYKTNNGVNVQTSAVK